MNVETLFASETQLWRTPEALVRWIEERDGVPFGLDAAASDGLICEDYYGPGGRRSDAFTEPWLCPSHQRVFCNPPYDGAPMFLRQGMSSLRESRTIDRVVFLIAARTDTRWWHDYWHQWDEVVFLKGRLKFWLTPAEQAAINAAREARAVALNRPFTPIAAENSAPFPSALLYASTRLAGNVRAPQVSCVDWRG